MQKVILTNRAQTIRENTTIMPDGFGGWLAQNIGTASVIIDGFTLLPGQLVDFSHIQPNVVWNTPIPVVCSPGGILRIMRFIYSEDNKRKEEKV